MLTKKGIWFNNKGNNCEQLDIEDKNFKALLIEVHSGDTFTVKNLKNNVVSKISLTNI